MTSFVRKLKKPFIDFDLQDLNLGWTWCDDLKLGHLGHLNSHSITILTPRVKENEKSSGSSAQMLGVVISIGMHNLMLEV